MFVYWALTALVASFVLVIVLQAWFVRQLTAYRHRLHTAREELHRVRAEASGLGETVSELNRGKDSTTLQIGALEQEIEELRQLTRTFLTENPALQAEFGAAADEAPVAARGVTPPADGSPVVP